MYRFRSTANLLGQYNELETETIFFAPPYKLNDPMEGYKNILFYGDKILWSNLFKNYINALLKTVLIFYVEQETPNLENEIAMYISKNLIDAPIYDLFKRIDEKILDMKVIQKILEYIVAKKSIKKVELQSFLYVIHPFALKIVMDELNSVFSFEDLFGAKSKDLDEESLINAIDNDLSLNSKDISLKNSLIQQQLLLLKSEDLFKAKLKKELVGAKNFNLIDKEFSYYFMDALESLIAPRWFTACFMTDCSNSSLWGSYGNNHSGVCLEFNPDNDNTFVLQSIDSSISIIPKDIKFELKLQEVKYNKDNKLAELDFFNFLIKIMQKKDYIKSQWFFDNEGHMSEYYERFEENQDDWTNAYNLMWKNITTTKDEVWKFENEYRLILNDYWDEYPMEGVTLKYDFKDLSGIIFGINTSEIDKFNIVRIVYEKCKKYNRQEFKFYQAYYDELTGDIKKVEIPALESFINHIQDIELYDTRIPELQNGTNQ